LLPGAPDPGDLEQFSELLAKLVHALRAVRSGASAQKCSAAPSSSFVEHFTSEHLAEIGDNAAGRPARARDVAVWQAGNSPKDPGMRSAGRTKPYAGDHRDSPSRDYFVWVGR
jgi:hypothetical protein